MANPLPYVANYTKNLIKSAVYATNDVAGELMPAYASFGDTNKEVLKEAASAIRNYRTTLNRIQTAITKSKIYEAGEATLANAKYDLAHGTFYNQNRIKAAEDQAMDNFGGGGDDFGGDLDFGGGDSSGSMDDIDKMLGLDESGGDDFGISEGDALISKSIKESSKASTAATGNAIIGSADAIMKSNRVSANILYAQGERLMSVTQTGFTALNETMANQLKFSTESVQQHFDNSKKFFESQDKLAGERNAMLKELLDMYRNEYKLHHQEQEEKEKKKKLRYGDIVDSNGMINIEGYMENVGNNFKTVLDDLGLGMVNTMGEAMGMDNPLMMFAQNPLGGLMTMLVGTMIGPKLQETAKNFDDTLSGVFGTFLAKMNSYAREDEMSPMGIIGKLLGVRDTVKSSLDTDTYKKGAIPWDGEAKQALVKVIPEYLASIENALTNRDHRVYDYERGRFVASKNLKAEWEGQHDRYVDQAMRDIDQIIFKYMGDIKDLTLEAQEARFENYSRFRKAMFSDPGQLRRGVSAMSKLAEINPKAGDKEKAQEVIDEMLLNLGFTGYNGEKDLKSILGALYQAGQGMDGTHGKLLQAAGKIYESRTKLDQERQNLQEKGLTPLMSLFDGSYVERIHEKTGFNISNQNSIVNSLNPNNIYDKQGNNQFFYLREMLAELIAIRTYGAGIGKSKNERAIEDKRKRLRRISRGVGTSGPSPGERSSNVAEIQSHLASNDSPKHAWKDPRELYEEARRKDEERHKQKVEEDIKNQKAKYKYIGEKYHLPEGMESSKILEIIANEEEYAKAEAKIYRERFLKEQQKKEAGYQEDKTELGKWFDEKKKEFVQRNEQTWKDIQQNGFLDTLIKAGTVGEKFGVIKTGLEQLADKPTSMLTKVLEQADEKLYNFFFLEEEHVDENGQPVEGFFGRLKWEMDDTFKKINDGINEYLLEPLKDKLGVEGPWDAIKKGFKFFNIDLDEIGDSIKGSAKDFFGPIKDRLKEMGIEFFKDAKEAIEEERRKANEAANNGEYTPEGSTSSTTSETKPERTESEKIQAQLKRFDDQIAALEKNNDVIGAQLLRDRKAKYEKMKKGTLDLTNDEDYIEGYSSLADANRAFIRSNMSKTANRISKEEQAKKDLISAYLMGSKDIGNIEATESGAVSEFRKMEEGINKEGSLTDRLAFYANILNGKNRITKKKADELKNKYELKKQALDEAEYDFEEGIHYNTDALNSLRDEVSKIEEDFKTKMREDLFDEFQTKLKDIQNQISLEGKKERDKTEKETKEEEFISGITYGYQKGSKEYEDILKGYDQWKNIQEEMKKGNFNFNLDRGETVERKIKVYDPTTKKYIQRSNFEIDANGNEVEKPIYVTANEELAKFVEENPALIFEGYKPYLDKFLVNNVGIESEDARKDIIADLKTSYISTKDRSTFLDIPSLKEAITKYRDKKDTEYRDQMNKIDQGDVSINLEDTNKLGGMLDNIDDSIDRLLGYTGKFTDKEYQGNKDLLDILDTPERDFGNIEEPEYPDFENITKNATEEQKGFFDNLGNRLESKLDKVIEAIENIDIPSPIPGMAEGGTVPKTGIYALSKGEIVIPRSFDPKEQAKDAKGEQAYIDKISNSIADTINPKNIKGYYGGTGAVRNIRGNEVVFSENVATILPKLSGDIGEAENKELDKLVTEAEEVSGEKYKGKRISDKIIFVREAFNKVAAEVQEFNTEKGIDIKGQIFNSEYVNKIKDQFRKVKSDQMGKEAKDFITGLPGFGTAAQGAKNIQEGFGEAMSRLLGFDSKEANKTLEETKKTILDATPDVAAHSIVGLVGGTLLGGPLIGAIAGASIGIVKNNEYFMKQLFGEKVVDSEGNESRSGGFFDQQTYEMIGKYAPSMKTMGLMGAIAGLVTPFGPLGGAMIGAGLGALKKNEDFQEMLYGKLNDKGQRTGGIIDKDVRDFFKKAAPNMAISAIGGMFLGPFGLVGNVMMGGALGMLGSTEAFKTHLFGAEVDGKRQGGIVGALREGIVEPWLEFGKKVKDDLFEWVKKDVFGPLKGAFTPIAKQIQLGVTGMFTGVGKAISRLFEVVTGKPLAKTLQDWLFKPFTKMSQGIISAALKPAKFLLSAPSKMIGAVGDALKRRQINMGNANYMTAGERLEFMEENGMNPEDNQWSTFDSKIATASKANIDELRKMTKLYATGDEGLKKDQDVAIRGLWATLDKEVKEGKWRWKGRRGLTGEFDRDYIARMLREGKDQEAIKVLEDNLGDMDPKQKGEIIKKVMEAATKVQRAETVRQNFAGEQDKLAKALKESTGIDINEGDNLNKMRAYLDTEYGAREVREKQEEEGKISEGEDVIHKSIVDQTNVLVEELRSLKDALVMAQGGGLTVEQKLEELNRVKFAQSRAKELEKGHQERSERIKGMLQGVYGSDVDISEDSLLHLDTEQGMKDLEKIIAMGKKGFKTDQTNINDLVLWAANEKNKKDDKNLFSKIHKLFTETGYQTSDLKGLGKLNDEQIQNIVNASAQGLKIRNLDEYGNTSLADAEKMKKIMDITGMDDKFLTPQIMKKMIDEGTYAMMLQNPRYFKISKEEQDKLSHEISHGEENMERTREGGGTMDGEIHRKRMDHTYNFLMNIFSRQGQFVNDVGRAGVDWLHRKVPNPTHDTNRIKPNKDYLSGRAIEAIDNMGKEWLDKYNDGEVSEKEIIEAYENAKKAEEAARGEKLPTYAKGGRIGSDQLAILSKGEKVINIKDIPRFAEGGSVDGNLALKEAAVPNPSETPKQDKDDKKDKDNNIINLAEERKKRRPQTEGEQKLAEQQKEVSKQLEKASNSLKEVMSNAKNKLENKLKAGFTEMATAYGMTTFKEAQDGSHSIPANKETAKIMDMSKDDHTSRMNTAYYTEEIFDLLKKKFFAKKDPEQKKKDTWWDKLFGLLGPLAAWLMKGGLFKMLKGLIPKIPDLLKGLKNLIPRIPLIGPMLAKIGEKIVSMKNAVVNAIKNFWKGFTGEAAITVEEAAAAAAKGSKAATEAAALRETGKLKKSANTVLEEYATMAGKGREGSVHSRMSTLLSEQDRALVQAMEGQDIKIKAYETPDLKSIAKEAGVRNNGQLSKMYTNYMNQFTDPTAEKLKIRGISGNKQAKVNELFEREFGELMKAQQFNYAMIQNARLGKAHEMMAEEMFERMAANKGKLGAADVTETMMFEKYKADLIKAHPELAQRFDFYENLYGQEANRSFMTRAKEKLATETATARGQLSAGWDMFKEDASNLKNRVKGATIDRAKAGINRATNAVEGKLFGGLYRTNPELAAQMEMRLMSEGMTQAEARATVAKEGKTLLGRFTSGIGDAAGQFKTNLGVMKEGVRSGITAAGETSLGRAATNVVDFYTAPTRAVLNAGNLAAQGVEKIGEVAKGGRQLLNAMDDDLATRFGKGYKVASFIPKTMVQMPLMGLEGYGTAANFLRNGITGNVDKLGSTLLEAGSKGSFALGKTVEEGASVWTKVGLKAGKAAEGSVNTVMRIIAAPIRAIAKLAGGCLGMLPGASAGKMASAFEKLAAGLADKVVKKGGARMLASLGAKALPVIGQALMAKDLTEAFYEGMTNPGVVLGIADQDTITDPERVMAAITNAIVKTATLGILEGSDVIDFVIDTIGPVIGFEGGNLKAKRDDAKLQLEAYNKEHGTNLNMKEYMEVEGKLNEKSVLDNMTDGAKYIAGKIVDFGLALPDLIVDGIKELAGKAFNIAEDIKGVKNYWDTLYNRAQAITWDHAGPEEIAQWNQQIQIDPNSRFAGIKMMMRDFATNHFFLMSTGGFIVSKVLDITKSVFGGIGDAFGNLGGTVSRIFTAVKEGHPLDVITAGYDAYQAGGYQGFGGALGSIAGTLLSGFAVMPALIVKIGRGVYETITEVTDSLEKVKPEEGFSEISKLADEGSPWQLLTLPNPFGKEGTFGDNIAGFGFGLWKALNTPRAIFNMVASAGFDAIEALGNFGGNKFDPTFYEDYKFTELLDSNYFNHREIEFDASKPMTVFGAFADLMYKYFKLPGKILSYIGSKVLGDGPSKVGEFFSGVKEKIEGFGNWWKDSDTLSKDLSTNASDIEKRLSDSKKTSAERVAEAKKRHEELEKLKNDASKAEEYAKQKRELDAVINKYLNKDEQNQLKQQSTWQSEADRQKIKDSQNSQLESMAKEIATSLYLTDNEKYYLANRVMSGVYPSEQVMRKARGEIGTPFETIAAQSGLDYNPEADYEISPAAKKIFGQGSGKDLKANNRVDTSRRYTFDNGRPETVRFMKSKYGKGTDIPEYNQIKDDDSIAVRKAKLKAQQKAAAANIGANYSQLDPSIKDIQFNKSTDTERMTIGERACGPMAMASAITATTGQRVNPLDMVKSVRDNELETDGGTKFNYFSRMAGEAGLQTEQTSDRKDILTNLRKGRPTILMGTDSATSTSTPFGPNPHYVTATGLTKDGGIIVQDPEERRSNVVYNANQVINKSTTGFNITPEDKSRIEKNTAYSQMLTAMRRRAFGRGSSKYGMGERYEDAAAGMSGFAKEQFNEDVPEWFWRTILRAESTGSEGPMTSEVAKAYNNFGGMDYDPYMKAYNGTKASEAITGGHYVGSFPDQDSGLKAEVAWFARPEADEWWKSELQAAREGDLDKTLRLHYSHYVKGVEDSGDAYKGTVYDLVGKEEYDGKKTSDATNTLGKPSGPVTDVADVATGSDTPSHGGGGGILDQFGGGKIGAMLASAFGPLALIHANLFGGNLGGGSSGGAGASATAKPGVITTPVGDVKPGGGSGLPNVVHKEYNWASPLEDRKETKKIILHHTGESNDPRIDNDRDSETIHQWHLGNGWAGIGYHFVIRKNGTIEEGRPIDKVGSHCQGENKDSVGIHLSGNYVGDNKPPEAQLKSLYQLIKDIATMYGLSVNRTTVRGHKEFCETDCPGPGIWNQIDDIANKAASCSPSQGVGKGSGKKKYGKGKDITGYNGPEYNKITDDDSIAVQKAKEAAQRKWLEANKNVPDFMSDNKDALDEQREKIEDNSNWIAKNAEAIRAADATTAEVDNLIAGAPEKEKIKIKEEIGKKVNLNEIIKDKTAIAEEVHGVTTEVDMDSLNGKLKRLMEKRAKDSQALTDIRHRYLQGVIKNKPKGDNYVETKHTGMGSKYGMGVRSTEADSQNIWNYLKQKGLSNVSAAAVMGNFQAESAMYSDRLQNHGVDDGSMTAPVDGVTGYGLAQWTYDSRQQALKNYASSVSNEDGDWKTQIDFMMSGKDGDVSGLFQTMDATNDPEKAALIFHDEFERSADDEEKKQRRADYAKQFFTNNGQGVIDGTSNVTSGSNGSSSSSSDINDIDGMFGGGAIGAMLAGFWKTDPYAKALLEKASKLGLLKQPSGNTGTAGAATTAGVANTAGAAVSTSGNVNNAGPVSGNAVEAMIDYAKKEGQDVEVNSPYGMRTHPIHGDQRMHSGVDLTYPGGTPVHTPAAGKAEVGYDGGYGNWVTVTDKNNMYHMFAHLMEPSVSNGQMVNTGDQIGISDTTGGSTGDHLHYGVHESEACSSSDCIDPNAYSVAGLGSGKDKSKYGMGSNLLELAKDMVKEYGYDEALNRAIDNPNLVEAIQYVAKLWGVITSPVTSLYGWAFEDAAERSGIFDSEEERYQKAVEAGNATGSGKKKYGLGKELEFAVNGDIDKVSVLENKNTIPVTTEEFKEIEIPSIPSAIQIPDKEEVKKEEKKLDDALEKLEEPKIEVPDKMGPTKKENNYKEEIKEAVKEVKETAMEEKKLDDALEKLEEPKIEVPDKMGPTKKENNYKLEDEKIEDVLEDIEEPKIEVPDKMGPTKKENNYKEEEEKFDEVGNLVDYKGPEYNLIDPENDSNSVKSAKLVAQRKWIKENKNKDPNAEVIKQPENKVDKEVEDEAKLKEKGLAPEVAPNGEHYEEKDIVALMEKGESRESAIVKLSKMDKYSKDKDKKKGHKSLKDMFKNIEDEVNKIFKQFGINIGAADSENEMDKLGNLKAYKGPEEAIIKEDDSEEVKKQKLELQKKWIDENTKKEETKIPENLPKDAVGGGFGGGIDIKEEKIDEEIKKNDLPTVIAQQEEDRQKLKEAPKQDDLKIIQEQHEEEIQQQKLEKKEQVRKAQAEAKAADDNTSPNIANTDAINLLSSIDNSLKALVSILSGGTGNVVNNSINVQGGNTMNVSNTSTTNGSDDNARAMEAIASALFSVTSR